MVAWQQQAEQREGERESRETSKEKHIILLCTVSRLNLHNGDTQQHKKRAEKLEMS